MEQTTIEPVVQNYGIAETFHINVPREKQIPGLAPGLAGVPDLDQGYVFDEERIRELTIFWVSGFRALKLEGDPAAGKTSLIEQWHARLHVPLYSVACAPNTDSAKLFGQLLPTTEGTLRWHDGPVTKACREGTSCLLDEYNTMDPGETTSLNLVLEGKSFTIPETGESIRPHEKTRFFVTQNPVDSKLMVMGRNLQDTANDDRFCYMKVDYLAPALEKAIVVRALTSKSSSVRVPDEVAGQIAEITVNVANSVRTSFRTGSVEIDKPLSTRSVVRWAKYSVMYMAAFHGKQKSGIHYALPRAVPLSSSMGSAINELITTEAGYDQDMSSDRRTSNA